MEYNHIEYKKPFYKVKSGLRSHLENYSRWVDLPINYSDLINYQDLAPVYNEDGSPTLWYSAIYRPTDLDMLREELTKIYELLVADGSKIPYLVVESIEFCSFGNSKPFRIKVRNEVNDNHDYFYIKRTDASRIYGLELEEVFSPDKISFLANRDTLVEEHIVGIPCDEFILRNENVIIDNRLRFAKEFVKFNERCYCRLLGDMRAYNFVVEITQDFDNVQYRLRAIDFDQQSYEGKRTVYLPQFFKDNKSLVDLATELLSPEIAQQYMKEERVAMRKRYVSARRRTRSLLKTMKTDKISTKENIKQLGEELAKYHQIEAFKTFTNMGDILALHLELKLGIKIFK